MFCPVCRLEYRPGFTQCSDCGVALVEQLPDKEDSTASGPPADPDAMVPLWAGVASRQYDWICAALDRVHIHYEVSSLKSILISAARDQSSEIRVRAADYDAAERVLLDVGDSEDMSDKEPVAQARQDAAMANPLRIGQHVFNRVPDETEPDGDSSDSPEEIEEPETDSGQPPPNDYVEEFDPDDATREVWSGENAATAQFINECLSGVDIGCVIKATGNTSRALVMPQDEQRARKVIREIVDGAPMQ
jgi:hypothetical protein